MMKFDLNQYEGQTLISANLHLTRHFSCPSSGTTATTFYAINQDWNEDSWNYTQHVSYSENINMPYVFSGDGGSAITDFEIDIMGFINSWLAGETENHGFVIIASSNQKFSKFYSKESTNELYQPCLTLEFDDSAIETAEIYQPDITASNYPNPFNPTTTISYEIANSGHVDISLYNFKGQLVDCLLSTSLVAGKHNLTFNGSTNHGNSLQSGIYYYCITTADQSLTRSMLLLK
jgi:hypothetical protein